MLETNDYLNLIETCIDQCLFNSVLNFLEKEKNYYNKGNNRYLCFNPYSSLDNSELDEFEYEWDNYNLFEKTNHYYFQIRIDCLYINKTVIELNSNCLLDFFPKGKISIDSGDIVYLDLEKNSIIIYRFDINESETIYKLYTI
jgi:hypothetical protein